MNEDRLKGKAKELEGKLQQQLGKVKETVEDAPDELHDRIEREKGKREADRERKGESAAR